MKKSRTDPEKVGLSLGNRSKTSDLALDYEILRKTLMAAPPLDQKTFDQ